MVDPTHLLVHALHDGSVDYVEVAVRGNVLMPLELEICAEALKDGRRSNLVARRVEESELHVKDIGFSRAEAASKLADAVDGHSDSGRSATELSRQQHEVNRPVIEVRVVVRQQNVHVRRYGVLVQPCADL